MWNDRITVGLTKPEKEPTDIREMRKAIEEASRDSSLIRQAFDTAYYMGLSGEDKYTLLAYHALRQLETHFQVNMKSLMLSPSPQVVVPAPNTGAGNPGS
jgi:hypothetical protein